MLNTEIADIRNNISEVIQKCLRYASTVIRPKYISKSKTMVNFQRMRQAHTNRITVRSA